jgi:rhamnogalacturonan acetylesterase
MHNNIHMKKIKITFLVIAAFIGLSSFAIAFFQQKPTLYIIGDSTVKNGDGTGRDKLWGWGSYLAEYFDTNRIHVENHAIGGRSSRTFIIEGRWDRILQRLQPGDFVIMQFGHNDGGPLDDTARARGTIKGIGDDSTQVYNPIHKMQEVVHTYGWYMRKYVDDTKAKGAIPIVCSPIPRMIFKDGKVERSNTSYGLWAQQTAESQSAYFIPLNDMIADQYEKLGEDSVKKYFPGDHTHTNADGARVNVLTVVQGIKYLNRCTLKTYLK